MKKILFLLGLCLFIFSCKSIPDKAEPVSKFNVDQYVGKWYEIARIDFKFEKDLNNTTAQYTLNSDGTVKVLNKGFNYVKNEWTEREGKAKFRDAKDVGALKVSFFGPFYSGYNVIALDDNYKYALVAGKNLDYLWILAREKKIPEAVKADFLAKAKAIGYDTNRLIWVEHNK